MDRERLLEATQELITFESTAGNGRELWGAYEFMHRFVGQTAVECGADITFDEFESGGKPSFVAYHGAARPKRFPLLLNAHIDVVPGRSDQFKKPTIENGRFYGRGVYDMKAAAIVMAALFCKYPGAGLQIVTDEELGGTYGTAYQVEQGVHSDFTICGECGRSPDERVIANEAKGVAVADIIHHGKAGHGAYPLQGANALDMGVDFILAMREQYPKPVNELLCNQMTTVTPLRLNSNGDALTQTPDLSTVRLDCRFLPGDANFKDEAAFAALINKLDPTAEVSNLHIWGDPMYTPPDDPLLQLLKAAAEEVEGGEFALVRRNGTSDGRFFSRIGGKACEFGIAGKDQHGPNEHITLESFDNFHRTLDTFLRNASLAGAVTL